MRADSNTREFFTMSRTIRKLVIPAAGMGTRCLPVTKVMAKEMLPV
jgi:UTP--glucose-1-phosphate uridylyltransferase